MWASATSVKLELRSQSRLDQRDMEGRQHKMLGLAGLGVETQLLLELDAGHGYIQSAPRGTHLCGKVNLMGLV